jgi:hypothetical protein
VSERPGPTGCNRWTTIPYGGGGSRNGYSGG